MLGFLFFKEKRKKEKEKEKKKREEIHKGSVWEHFA